jgi:hypothetical protein
MLEPGEDLSIEREPVFPEAGKYFVEILLNGDLVIAYPIILTVLKN